MPIVTILPNETFCPEGARIEVKTGAKLAQALNAAGIKIPHACEYNCACATCHVIVKEGFIRSARQRFRQHAAVSFILPDGDGYGRHYDRNSEEQPQSCS